MGSGQVQTLVLVSSKDFLEVNMCLFICLLVNSLGVWSKKCCSKTHILQCARCIIFPNALQISKILNLMIWYRTMFRNYDRPTNRTTDRPAKRPTDRPTGMSCHKKVTFPIIFNTYLYFSCMRREGMYFFFLHNKTTLEKNWVRSISNSQIFTGFVTPAAGFWIVRSFRMYFFFVWLSRFTTYVL